MKNIVLISQLGISMIAPVLLCVWLGVWLDNKFQSHWTIPLIIFGVLAGARNVYALVKQASEDKKEEEDEET